MTYLSIIIAIATLLTIVLLMFYNYNVMKIAGDKIFGGSGKPISMVQTIMNSIESTGQFLFGILAVGLLLILMIEDKITNCDGLPIISIIIGYLLGKSRKGITVVGEDDKQ